MGVAVIVAVDRGEDGRPGPAIEAEDRVVVGVGAAMSRSIPLWGRSRPTNRTRSRGVRRAGAG